MRRTLFPDVIKLSKRAAQLRRAEALPKIKILGYENSIPSG